MMAAEVVLGPCCACGRESGNVRNIICLNYKAPVPGTGWGCFQCGLPMDGATAVLCDGCLESEAEIQWVIHGMPVDKARVQVGKVEKKPFTHRMEFHPEVRR